jgi:hypothetical protein
LRRRERRRRIWKERLRRSFDQATQKARKRSRSWINYAFATLRVPPMLRFGIGFLLCPQSRLRMPQQQQQQQHQGRGQRDTV